MSETLYRKYRPKNFSEVIGQAHIVRTLINSIKNGRIGSAYLFTGPRGTGKTSIARILGKTANCENQKNAISCEKCASCREINAGRALDIIEIDAASNTGVDNIRELRETVVLAPAALKYKIYIIDEVHMLSTGAFNALLKTLEEPPAHAIFILATTEIHKVPETILSRCQRFDFARLPMADIISKLSLIAESEKVKIEREALEMVAIAAEGGMRDAESILGQIISLEDKNITVAEVAEILGTAEKSTAFDLAQMIIKNDSSGAIEKINNLSTEGYDLQVFNKSFVNFLRQIMLLKVDPALKKFLAYELSKEQLKKMEDLAAMAELPQILTAINLFLDSQSKIAASILPQLPLEIAAIKATQKFPEISHSLPTGQAGTQPTTHDINANNILSQEKNNNLTIKQFNDNRSKEDLNQSEKNIDLYAIKRNWNKLLTDIRPYNHSLSALLSNCLPVEAKGNKIKLGTAYGFYGERLNETKNKLTIEEVLSKILGCTVKIEVVIDKNLAVQKDGSAVEEKLAEQENLLDSALEIMGGKVVE